MIRIHRPVVTVTHRHQPGHDRRQRGRVAGRCGGRGAAHKTARRANTAGSPTVAPKPCAARDTAARRAPGVADNGWRGPVSAAAAGSMMVAFAVISGRCAARTPTTVGAFLPGQVSLETRRAGFATPTGHGRWRKTIEACPTASANLRSRATRGYRFAPPSAWVSAIAFSRSATCRS